MAFLTKILNLEGIGLLHGASTPPKTPFQQVTLLYGENGRGKSTLTSLLRSCSNQDSELVEERVTVDAGVMPAAKLMFEGSQATYENGAWGGYRPEVLVYDGSFVNENVHTGMEVTPGQRANLLDFALGSSAVKARQRETQATDREQKANQLVKTRRAALQGLIKDVMPIPQFRVLPELPDVEVKLAEVEQKIQAVQRVDEIKRKPMPKPPALPNLDIKGVFSVLSKTLSEVHAAAASRVAQHMGSLSDANCNTWIQKGLELTDNKTCPFCGQGISDVDLISMYRVFFDHAYADLQREVADIEEQVLKIVQPSLVDEIAATRNTNNVIFKQWSDLVLIPEMDSARDEYMRELIKSLRDILESLLIRKSTALTEAHGSDEELQDALRIWSRVQSVCEDENSVIAGHAQRIEAYKSSLEASSLEMLQSDLLQLNATKLRYEDATVASIGDLEAAEREQRDAESDKRRSRDELNREMSQTLNKFKDEINTHLDRFHANFQISSIKHNYRGGSPRVDYGIQLRGKAVELNGGRPTFATALSEGDKKTMGFAFFAASTLADTELKNKIVVIDDPMSSLDASRRDHTQKVITEIASAAGQVILMAHDAFFLRDIQGKLKTLSPRSKVGALDLRGAKGGYSAFGELDLDYLCQSKYLQDYQLVTNVVSGELNDPKDVAQGAVALRPLLEGYLHRKYPGTITAGLTLGSAIADIERKKDSNSPCAPMAKHTAELHQMNNYAKKFHHNTGPDMEAALQEPQSTVVANGRKVLDFIHST
ncbi:wobble nucleotide-excising tRNase [Kocuria rhizophila]|uniref:AAA family ATPase n=1 Tax=Kocuria rhizophila TaxID=72000 RepID=UPI00285F2269|nr:AAA family ATPase [Kocuria rhizophila]MDR7373594.1 wobble nucleotide-excising tRNase [Kocuria rhizophila]